MDIGTVMREANQLEFMQYKANKTVIKYRFDFEIGCLIKSPCRGCERRRNFPECIDDCTMLDKIQTRLSEAVSCERK